MSKLKSISRSGTLAWSTSKERPALVAAGTVAGAIDDSFECSASLEIFNLDLASTDQAMPVLGSVTTSERFQRLAWGAGSESVSYPLGILAGGMVDGSIKIFNPSAIIDGDSEHAVVASMDKHHGPVRGLEFNWNQPHLLASGASDADMYITDLSNPASPSFYTPGQRQQQSAPADISCVAWNRKVHHILASTSQSGQTVVWDLKLKRPVISFNDPNNKTQRNSVVCWNPEVATQLMVASEDDNYPLMQMWDLRNAFAPVKELRGHTKGILAASWCPFDNGLLLSAGKDNRTLCWDPLLGTVLCELPASANWNFDVQWSPRLPAVLSTGSFDGQVAIYSLTDCAPPAGAWTGGPGAEAPPNLQRAPKWLKPPCGASFGFGGQLVSFAAPAPGPQGGMATRPAVHRAQVVTEASVAARATELQAALDANRTHELCEAKMKAAEGAGRDRDKAVWGLLSVLSAEDARQELIKYLHIDDDGVAEAPSAPPAKAAAAPELDEDAAQSLAALAVADGAPASEGNGTAAAAAAHAKPEPPPAPPASMEPQLEAALRRAVVRGSFEEAVQMCAEKGHMAEALLLAASGGPDLWCRARDNLLAAHPAPFMRVLSAVVHHSFDDLVDGTSLAQWRETLAILNTYAADEDLAPLCNRLATRLQAEGHDPHTALLCFMCAGNVAATTQLWLAQLKAEEEAAPAGAVGAPARASALVEFVERIFVLRALTGDTGADGPPGVAERLAEYAALLSSEGLLATASAVLLHAGASSAVDLLRYRIFHSGQLDVRGAHAPAAPFSAVNVGVAPAAPAMSVASRQHVPAQQPAARTPGIEQSELFAGAGPMGQQQPAFAPAPQPPQPVYAQQSNPYAQPQAPAPTHNAYAPQQQQQQPTAPAPYQPAASYAQQPAASYAQPVVGGAYAQPAPQPAGGGYGAGAAGGYPQSQPAPPPQPTATAPHVFTPVAPPPGSAAPPPPPAAYAQQPQAAPPPASTAPAPAIFTPVAPPAQPAAAQAQPTPAPQPVQPPAPPPPQRMQDADTSAVTGPNLEVVRTLNQLMDFLLTNAPNPMEKRKFEDVSKRLGALLVKLNSNQVSPSVCEKLYHICQALMHRDYATATSMHVGLTTTDWADNGLWLVGLKRMIEALSKGA